MAEVLEGEAGPTVSWESPSAQASRPASAGASEGSEARQAPARRGAVRLRSTARPSRRDPGGA
eukprot:4933541-Alexandrium_andersonii.AAC.1